MTMPIHVPSFMSYSPFPLTIQHPSVEDRLYEGLILNDVEMVQDAINKGADLFAHCGDLEETPLQYACRNGLTAIVEEILRRVHPDASHRGRSPLCLAARNGKYDIVRVLIKKGADVNRKDFYGNTALEDGSDFYSITELFLKAKVDLNLGYYLHNAIGDPSVVSLLINAKADIEKIDKYMLMRPLHRAAYVGDAVSLNQLLKAGADLFAKSGSGNTALTYALMRQKNFKPLEPKFEKLQRIVEILNKKMQEREGQEKMSIDQVEKTVIPPSSTASTMPASISSMTSSSSSSSSSIT